MTKITSKGKLVLYGCSGIGVNMLNIIVGSYLCSALLTGGFDKDIEFWTYLNKDLVIAGMWGIMVFVAKAVDGIIDVPLSAFIDNLKTKFGKRKTGILTGFIPMVIAYALFLVPIDKSATVLNTVWFAFLLLVFYTAYTLTMLTYYATFAEITDGNKGLTVLSTTKSICDVVYFSLGFALVPAFVGMGINIRTVALAFLPLSLSMVIPLALLKENSPEAQEQIAKAKKVSLKEAIGKTFKCKEFISWLCVLCIMNFGLQLFLSGINEFFSTAGLNMTLVMASCFVPVPGTIFIYNKIVKKKGLGFAYRYVLTVFSVAMAMMFFCSKIPADYLLPFAVVGGLIVSLSIGAFFSVTYTVPSQLAAQRKAQTGEESTSTMFFAVQGLFEGISAGIASGIVLVFLKEHSLISYMTLIVAVSCMLACFLSKLLPKSVNMLGKETKSEIKEYEHI